MMDKGTEKEERGSITMTLKEIASMAGVSAATVSYVLNNTAQVSEETRKRVEKIIKETGYRSNILAKSLRTNESFLIGVIVEDITVWHTAHIIDGINEIAEARGYNTILNNLRLLSKIESQFEHISNFQKDIDKAVDVLIGMQVDGIIYVGMHDRKISHVLHDIKKNRWYIATAIRMGKDPRSAIATKKNSLPDDTDVNKQWTQGVWRDQRAKGIRACRPPV